jgi:hypothetical protein
VAVEGVEAWRRCWGIKKFFLVNLQYYNPGVSESN